MLTKANYDAEIRQIGHEANALRNLLSQERAAGRITSDDLKRHRTIIKDRNILINQLNEKLGQPQAILADGALTDADCKPCTFTEAHDAELDIPEHLRGCVKVVRA